MRPRSRFSSLLAVLLALATLVAIALAAPSPAAATSNPLVARAALDAARAQTAAHAMRSFFLAGDGLYRETYPFRPYVPHAWLWPFSQAMAATLDLAPLGDDAQGDLAPWLQNLAHYWEGSDGPYNAYNASVRPPLGVVSETYYDDNAWAGLDLARAYTLTADPAALAQAERVFSFLVSGWADTAPCGAIAGGVYWLALANRFSWDRTATATAASAVLALRLYAITRSPYYLSWAQRLYDWMDAHLRDPADGLYWDHVGIASGGSCWIDTDKVAYAQGVMVEANLLFYRVLRSPLPRDEVRNDLAATYLQRAEDLAQASLLYSRDGYSAQNPAYTAIYFRALLELVPLADDRPDLQRTILQVVRGYADWAWQALRDPATNLFRYYSWSYYAWLLDQAAMVEIYASLASYEMAVLTVDSCAAPACAT